MRRNRFGYSLMLLMLPMAFAMGFSISAHTQGLAVSPSRLFFTGQPGERISQRIMVQNPSEQRMIFKITLKDFIRDSLGEKIYFPPGELPGSNANWVEALPGTLELAPGEKKDLPVYLQIPGDRALSQHGVSRSMLFLSQISEQTADKREPGAKRMGVQVRLEMAIHLYYTPAHCHTRSLEFISFEDRGNVQSGKDSVRRCAVTIKNTGDLSADAALRLELTNKSSGEETKLPEKMVSLLPGATQIIYCDLPRLKGKYLAVAMLDSGDQNDLQVAEKDILY